MPGKQSPGEEMRASHLPESFVAEWPWQSPELSPNALGLPPLFSARLGPSLPPQLHRPVIQLHMRSSGAGFPPGQVLETL